MTDPGADGGSTPGERLPDVPAAVDVLVVGNGPTGRVLSILLARAGRRVLVVERFAAPYPLPRAVHLDGGVARILQSCGLGSWLASDTEPAEVYEWQSARGETLLRFGRIGTGASGWPQSNMFHQPSLEAALGAEQCRRPGLDVATGVTVTSLRTTSAGVEVGVRATAGAGTRTVRATHVVGCDGAQSATRDLLGVGVADLGFVHDWLVVDVVLHDERVFDPVNQQRCDPARPVTAVSGGPGRRRWEFMRLPGETLEGLAEPARTWELLAPFDVHPANATLERSAGYTFRARWAERWRVGPVLLAGDAAHQMPPFAGQGMCSGVRDAANLAWKLALVGGGRAHDSLLDTYQRERLDDVRQQIDLSTELGRVICVTDPEAASARDEVMRSTLDGLTETPPPAGLGVDAVVGDGPLAGAYAPQPVLADGRLFDDAVGGGGRFVLVSTEPVGGGEATTWLERAGGALVDPHRTPAAAAAMAPWLEGNGVTAALIRPDFHVFDAGVDASALVDALRLALTLPDHTSPRQTTEVAR